MADPATPEAFIPPEARPSGAGQGVGQPGGPQPRQIPSGAISLSGGQVVGATFRQLGRAMGFPGLGDAVPSDVIDAPQANPEGFLPPELGGAGGSDAQTALTQGAVGGLVEGTGMVGGAIAGAKAGARIFPARPVIAGGIGAVVGGVMGSELGHTIRGQLAKVTRDGVPITTPEISDIPPDLRPYAIAGESFAGSLPFMAAPMLAPVGYQIRSTGMVGNWINRVIRTAKASPKAFALAEGSAAVSAALAGGAAESVAPGEIGTRVASEVAAGALNPTKMAIGAGRVATSYVGKVMQAFSAEAQETAASKWLKGVLELAGEDPALVAQLARETDPLGLVRTIAQKTGSPTMAAIEQHVAGFSHRFSTESRAMATDSLETINRMFRALHNTGDPQALVAAAQIRSKEFNRILSSRLAMAEQTAADAAARITTDNATSRMEISRLASESVGEVLSEARKAESELWDAIPTDATTGIDGLVAAYKKAQADLPWGAKLPAFVNDFVREAQEQIPGSIPMKQLIGFRSKALELARQAQDQLASNDARVYGELAESVLDDMDTAYQGMGGAIKDQYDLARSFSRELNDVFTRSFAGKSRATGKYGPRIPPETLIKKALASGGDAGSLQLADLEEATRFMLTKGKGDASAYQTMLDAQSRVVRLAAADSVDPVTGKVNASRLSRFVQSNQALLSRFPAVQKDLTDAITSETARKGVERSVKNASKLADQKSAFTRLLGTENPDMVVGTALRGKTPTKDLRRLIQLARRGGPEGMDGLKAAIYDFAVKSSSATTGTQSIDQIKATLFNPVSSRGKPLIDILTEEGLVDSVGRLHIETLFEEAGKIQKALKADTSIDEMENVPDFFYDLMIRSTGSFVAGKAAPSSTAGHGLIVHAAGSRFAQQIFAKLPMKKTQEVFVEALLNPEFGAKLLSRADTAAARFDVGSQIHAYMFQAGMFGITEDYAEIPESEEPGSPSAF